MNDAITLKDPEKLQRNLGLSEEFNEQDKQNKIFKLNTDNHI